MLPQSHYKYSISLLLFRLTPQNNGGIMAIVRFGTFTQKAGKAMEISKQDWNLFRSKIVLWQEAYMDRLNKEYINILSGEGNPSDKFWKLEKKINADKRHRGVVIRLRKQDLAFDLAALINDGVIALADIDEFSEELKEIVAHLCGCCFTVTLRTN